MRENEIHICKGKEDKVEKIERKERESKKSDCGAVKTQGVERKGMIRRQRRAARNRRFLHNSGLLG